MCVFNHSLHLHRGILEIGFRNHVVMKQKLQDTLSRMQREREKDLRNFKKMEMQLKIALESLAQVKSHYERVHLEVCVNKLHWRSWFCLLA